MPEGGTPMRGPAAPTGPGTRDARSEVLLGTPAVDAPPAGIAPAPGAVTATSPRPDTTRTPTRSGGGDDSAPEPAAGTAPAESGTGTAPAGVGAEGARDDRSGPGTARRPGEPDGPGPASAPARAPHGPTAEAAAVPGPPLPAATAPGAVPVPAVPGTDGPAAGTPAPVPAAPAAPRPRRGTADPVRVLMHRHRELCERAVDPLEIAAGLEARGFTDRTAARYRHRDVFSLAEELYARVPRGREETVPPAPRREAVAPWALAVLAPGAAAALTGLGLGTTHGTVRLAVGAAGALGLGGALLLAVRRGPLGAPGGRTVPAAGLWTLWLLAYAAGGDGFLAEVLSGGPDDLWELTPGPLLGLALAVAPAAWCAHLFTLRVRRRIAASRGLADFAASARRLLLGTVALHLLALAALLGPTGFSPGAFALGALLLLARLLTAHGFPETATAALAAACAAEALAPASVLSSRLPLPGFDALAVPVRAVVGAWGLGAVPTLVCGAAALGLLAHATGVLTRASAHTAP
ncbi:hypothetical protein [Streptomyces sp. NPDC001744]|uniref:hypothetical protein n=1 Tax=Streptomyces sp. NPDC001744 TaxID=3364606 RepID=UPI0036A01765